MITPPAVLDYDRKENAVLVLERDYFEVRAGQGQGAIYGCSAQKINCGALTGAAIYFVAGDSPDTRRLVRHDRHSGQEEEARVAPGERSPLLTAPEGDVFYLEWFNQDPAQEQREGWRTVRMLHVPRTIAGEFLVYQARDPGKEREVAWRRRLTVVTPRGKIAKVIHEFEQDHLEPANRAPLSPSGRYVAYAMVGVEADSQIHVHDLTTDEHRERMVQAGTLAVEGARWCLHDQALVFGVVIGGNSRFYLWKLTDDSLHELPFAGAADEGYHVIQPNTLVCCSSGSRRIETHRIEFG